MSSSSEPPPPDQPDEPGEGGRSEPPRPTPGGLPGDSPAGGGLPGWEPPAGGQSWQPQGWESQWQQAPPASSWPPAQQGSSGKATAALVLGICGLAVCPLICSVLALIFGYQGRSEIDASGGRLGGRGSAVAGIILGWVGVVLCVLGIVLIIVLAAIGELDDDTNNSDLQFDNSSAYRLAIAIGGALLRLATH